MAGIDASVIVLTKNAGAKFPDLLQRLYTQKFEGAYEVIVIDSGSTDGTLSLAQGFPARVTRIEPGEFHHGRTRNLGAELSNGGILVYITQDALPLNRVWLQRLTDNLNEPQVAMVVGRQIPWPATKPPEKFFYLYNFPPFKVRVSPGAADYYHDNVFISNVNSAIRKDVWQKFRFSEDVLMAEDKELAKRLLLGGWHIVYEPEAAVYHAHDFSLRSVFRRSLDYGESLRQGAAGLPRSRKSLPKRLLDYSREEIRYLRTTGKLVWLPYCACYDTSKYAAMFLGKTGLVKSAQRSRQPSAIIQKHVAI
jgi:rhamnosyltransferase